jgi:hypothetical protein
LGHEESVMKKTAARKKGKAEYADRQQLDADTLKVIKTSGILNNDITLDQLMNLSRELNSFVEARSAFIFRHFLYRPC